MKIKLLKGIVFQGSVWLPGGSPPVNAAEAKKLVDDGVAEFLTEEKEKTPEKTEKSPEKEK